MTNAQEKRTLAIKVGMVKKGLTQEKLAEMLGVTITTLNFKLKGTNDWKVSELEKLIDILDLDISEIFSGQSK